MQFTQHNNKGNVNNSHSAMKCTKCHEPMSKRRSMRADISFLGCKTWRKCGRHDDAGELIDPFAWDDLTTKKITAQEEAVQRLNDEHALHQSLLMGALKAIILQRGEKKKWDLDGDHMPHGQAYRVELPISKEAYNQLAALTEPHLEIHHKGNEIVIRLTPLPCGC